MNALYHYINHCPNSYIYRHVPVVQEGKRTGICIILAIVAFFTALAIGNAVIYVEKEDYTETIELSEDTVTFVPTGGKAKVELHKKRPVKDKKQKLWLWLILEETKPESYTIYVPKEKM